MKTFVTFIAISWLLFMAKAWSAESAPPQPEPSATPSSSTDASGAEKVNVDNIKEKYWARGDESEIGVVQNRLFTKERKFEIGAFGGFANSDPFLSIKTVGFSLGYHFSETFGVTLFAWKDLVNPSSAADSLSIKDPTQIPNVINNDVPGGYYGVEAEGSLLYGKLSVIGKAIIHYDLYLLGGLGTMIDETGGNLTEHIGIGQRFYISRDISIRFDYRFMHYMETVLQKTIPTEFGQPVQGPGNPENNYTHSLTLGVSWFVGGPK